MSQLHLILGGARSGKSSYAESLATPPRCYIATAEAGDAEFATRIARHRAARGDDWDLTETPLDLPHALTGRPPGETLLVDCLTLWLSNLMHAERDLGAAGRALIAAAQAHDGTVLLVSNELGMGLVPQTTLGRRFRDAQGRLNQQVAAAADTVTFVAAGLPLKLK